jgi:glycosyltransferase involved in cell wall biosynthesis
MSNPLKIIKNSKLMILTSYFEGTPMTALESMGLSVPIISTKTDGMKVLIKDGVNGYLYDTNEEAVEKILKIVNSDKKKYVDYLTKYSTDYNDIEKYKDQILKAYK